MQGDFDKAFEHVVGLEGGYTDGHSGASKYDPGGETKFGISKRAYPDLNIANLTLDEAKEIYRADYWEHVHGDLLPYPLNIFVFDAAVNQGVTPAIKMLQKTLGVEHDGVLGPKTIAAAQVVRSEAIALYMADRAMRYANTSNFQTFGRGWLKRLFVLALEA